MRRDSRLSRVLHILLHMQARGGTTTSDAIAAMLNANPTVVRRTMAGLRDAGYVDSEKGHGGGWRLTCDLRTVTMLDIYTALERPTVFAMDMAHDHPNCQVEHAVNRALGTAFAESERFLMAKLAATTLADLAVDSGWSTTMAEPVASEVAS